MLLQKAVGLFTLVGVAAAASDQDPLSVKAANFVEKLGPLLSPGAGIVTDTQSAQFSDLISRWSNVNKSTPAVIVTAATEDDVVNAVRAAVDADIPFVPASGGKHGNYGFSSSPGAVIDTSLLSVIKINKRLQTVTVQAGVVTGCLTKALANEGFVWAFPGLDDIGVVSSATNGGLSGLGPKLGYNSDHILSARLVLANGTLITVSAEENSDLFWALRGAGGFFGFITELTLEIYPFSVLDAGAGNCSQAPTVWIGSNIFNISQLDEVIEAHRAVIEAGGPINGLTLIGANAPSTELVIIAEWVYVGPTDAAEAAYAPLLAIEGIAPEADRVEVWHMNDGVGPYASHDGYKFLDLTGATAFPPAENFQGVVKALSELYEAAPDTINTAWGFDWGYSNGKEGPDTAFAHRNVVTYLEALTWWSDPASEEVSLQKTREAITAFSAGMGPIQRYQGFTRVTDQPLTVNATYEQIYGPAENVDKLHALKLEYDPQGVFTPMFLDLGSN